MFSLEDTIDSLNSAGVNISTYLLFGNNRFSEKIYLFDNSDLINQPIFNKVYNTLLKKTSERDENRDKGLLVSSINVWCKGGINLLVHMNNLNCSTELQEVPQPLFDIFSTLPNRYFDSKKNKAIIEITCEEDPNVQLIDRCCNDGHLQCFGFQVIYHTDDYYNVIKIDDTKIELEAIRNNKILAENLISKKLTELNGQLLGIRQDYITHNINTTYLTLFYELKNIEELEKKLQLDFLNKKNIKKSNEPILPNSNNITETSRDSITLFTLIDDIVVPDDCSYIIKRIKKFSPSPLTVEKTIDVERDKLAWLYGITPDMIRSFKIFKATLIDATSGFHPNTSVLKPIEKTQALQELNSDCHVTESEGNQNLKISMSTKLIEVELPLPLNRVVIRVNLARRKSLTVDDFLNIDNSWFLNLSGVKSKQYVAFLSLKQYFQNALTKSDIHTNSQTIDLTDLTDLTNLTNLTNLTKSIGQNASDNDEVIDINLNSLKPFDICIGDWEDIVEIAQKKHPNAEQKQFNEIELQILKFYEFQDIHTEDFVREVVKIKETADWLYPGDYQKQLSYLKSEIGKIGATYCSDNNIRKINEITNTNNQQSEQEKTPQIIVPIVQNEKKKSLDFKPNDICIGDWEDIVNVARKKHPEQKIEQSKELKLQISKFYELHNIETEDFAPELKKLKDTADWLFPGDYERQLSYLNEDIRVLHVTSRKVDKQKELSKEVKFESEPVIDEQKTINRKAIIQYENKKSLNFKPNDISLDDWGDIVTVAQKEHPYMGKELDQEIELQIDHFYMFHNFLSKNQFHDTDKIKDDAEFLYTGNYRKKFLYLEQAVKKLEMKSSLTKAESKTLFKPITPNQINSSKYTLNKIICPAIDSVSSNEQKAAPEQQAKTYSAPLERIAVQSTDIIKDKLHPNFDDGKQINFVIFNEQNKINIEIKSLRNTEAFNFESINNELNVIINIDHPFYSKLYCNSSSETKRAINLMISSFCHLSFLNISEKVKQQDRKFFSRWSEYLEEYLLEE